MFDLSYRAGTTPLTARTNGAIYISLIVAIVIAVIFAIIAFILKKINAHLTSKEYIESEKHRPTKYADIKRVKAKFNFTAEEANLLWEICKATEPDNIYYLIRDNNQVDQIFRQAYNIMKEIGATDKKFFDFFQLRYKMEQALSQVTKISTTRGIPENSMLFYITAEGEQFPFTVMKNTKDCIDLEIPDFLANSPRRPENLKKIKFLYKAPNYTSYLFAARPIRYTNGTNGKSIMVIAHSNTLIVQSQRNSRRETVNEKCLFAAAKMSTDKKGKNFFEVSPNHYPANLLNVSAGGCCIHTKLPIKEKQLICVWFPSLSITRNTIGIIRHTRKIPERGLYAIHIQFTDIDIISQNKIYSFVYKFEL